MTDQLEENLRETLLEDAEAFHRRRPAGPRTMTAQVKSRIRRREIGWVLTAVVSAGLVVAGTLWVVPSLPGSFESRSAAPTLAGSDIVDVPPRGQAAAVFLEDGNPAFVVTHEDGSVSVVDAFSSHAPWGIEYLVWWCPSGGWFEDPFHGSKYDEHGTYRDGPGPSSLGVFRTDVVEPGRLRVRSGTAYVAPRPGQIDSSPPPLGGKNPGVLTPSPFEPVNPRGPYCTTADEAVFHRISSDDVTSLDAIMDAPDGWTALEGTLVLEADQPVRMCADDQMKCVPLAVPFIAEQVRRFLEPGTVDFHKIKLPGPLWMARIVDGEVLSVATPVSPGLEGF
jgi:hypothetical protein